MSLKSQPENYLNGEQLARATALTLARDLVVPQSTGGPFTGASTPGIKGSDSSFLTYLADWILGNVKPESDDDPE